MTKGNRKKVWLCRTRTGLSGVTLAAVGYLSLATSFDDSKSVETQLDVTFEEGTLRTDLAVQIDGTTAFLVFSPGLQVSGANAIPDRSGMRAQTVTRMDGSEIPWRTTCPVNVPGSEGPEMGMGGATEMGLDGELPTCTVRIVAKSTVLTLTRKLADESRSFSVEAYVEASSSRSPGVSELGVALEQIE